MTPNSEPANEPSRLAAVRAGVSRHPLVVFFALAYLLSWSWWIPIYMAGDTVRKGIGWPTHIPGLLGPLLAAVITTATLEGRAGLRRLGRGIVRWRAGWWWLVIPVTLGAGAIGVLASGKPVTAADLTGYSGVSTELGGVLTVAFVFVFNGIGEEAGWRGFAVERMLRNRSLTSTSLLIVLAWAPWHLPMFFIVDTFRGFSPLEMVGWLLGLASGSFVLTWLFRGSGGSVPLVAAWHTAYNFTTVTPVAAAVTSMLVLTAALIIAVLATRDHHRRRRIDDS